MNLLRSKKGNILNYMSVIVLLVIFGFLSIFSVVLYDTFTGAMTDAGLYTGDVKEVGDKFASTLRFYDTLIVFLLLGAVIGTGVTSFKIAANPVFFIVTLIFGAIFGLLSFYFNFVFAQMVSPSVFTASLVYFPKTLIVCSNLHWVMLMLIVIGSITLYAKRERGQFLS